MDKIELDKKALEAATKVYADAIGYYVEFHKGLNSESSNKMRAGMRKAIRTYLAAAPRGKGGAVMGEAPTEAQVDLRKNWNDFCDCDCFEGADTFSDRMELAGLIELVPVDAEALEDAFAAERGIEPNGMMWRLTDAGRTTLRASKEP